MRTDQEKNAIDFNMDFRYENETEDTLKQVEGHVSKGRCIVLCGSSGCGKSTILRCINHLIPQFYDGTLKGFCQINGQDLEDRSIGEVGKLAASVFQDPRSQFFTLNSSTEVAFGLENFGIPHAEMTDRVEKAFQHFHLDKLKDRNVFELSSGERQLIAILAAWAMDTDIFLLDEPTANLDYTAIEQLHEVLSQLKANQKTLFISEHRLYYLNGIADEYWLMEHGEIKRRYSAEEMAQLPEEEVNRIGLRTTNLENIVPKIQEIPEISCENQFEAKNIQFKYKKLSDKILDGVSLKARTGEVVGLIGSNGCGKTTLGKLMAGLYRPLSGQFYVNGQPVSHKALSRESIFIMQEAEFQFFTNSVTAELSYGKKDTPELKSEIQRLLTLVDMWQCRNQHPFSLSGGQMQKLVLLLAYLSPKPIVVLDEPTAGLDYNSLKNCVSLIREMQKTKIVFIITHDLELISQVCTRCIGLSKGRVSQEFDLSDSGTFCLLKHYMQTQFQLTDNQRKAAGKKSGKRLDPRVKLLLLAVSLAIGVWTDLPLILTAFAGLLLAAAYERHGGIIGLSGGAMGLILLVYGLFPTTITSFIAHFFPRMILMGTAAALILAGQEASRTLAGLRKLHVPERAIMICSVIFRFFPVLSADIGIMSQSVRTRGFFSTLGEKIKAVPEYLEIMIVPMVFRVIRIAEALSASAETRGIALSGKRDCYVSLELRPADYVMVVIFAVLVITGLLI